VALSLETGYRLIDTARIYGNEDEVGRGMRDAQVPREEIFLTSKVWRDDLSPGGVERALEESLRELQTDYLDLFLIHWPNEAFPLEKSLEALAWWREKGRIRNLGVSNFPAAMFRRACTLAPVFTNQVEYHPLLGQERLLEVAREHDALLTAYSPLAQGAVFKEQVLTQIGERLGKSAGQVALRWLLQQDRVIAIPRSSKPDNLRANFALFDFELSQDEMNQIDRLPKDQRQVDPGFAPKWDA